MQTLNQKQIKVSRRSFAVGSGAVALSSASLLGSAPTRANPTKRGDEYENADASPRLTARVVAFQAAPVDTGRAVVPSQALEMITSQIGPVDLVAFHPAAQAVQWDDLEKLSREAKEHSCYVAVGVAGANHKEWSHTLIGPKGDVIGSGLAFEDVVCETDIGLVALSANAKPHFESAPDILIHSPSDDVVGAPSGSYTIRLANKYSSFGSAIYAPDGRSMTRAGAGWTQGLVATLNLSTLRRSRQIYNGPQV